MPGRDQTGPLGTGSKTGRGMGDCGDFTRQATGFRGGFGFRRGGAGRGFRNRFFAAGNPGGVVSTPEQEMTDLNAQVGWLKGQLEAIQKRIEELTSK